MKRVVITGINIISPAGYTVESNWNSVLNGESWISPINNFDVERLKTKVAGQINLKAEHADFFDTIVDKKTKRRIDDFIYYGIISSVLAFRDAGLEGFVNDANAKRFGVMMTSGIGGVKTIYKNSETLALEKISQVSPFFLPGILINLLPGNIAIKLGLKGLNLSHISACASSSHSIGEAFKAIKYGRLDVCLAGGSEFGIAELPIIGFESMGALSSCSAENAKTASKPLDKERDGFVMSEGSACLILEEYDHAIKRGAKIYAEITGYGASCDASHITTPDPNGNGIKSATAEALEEAGILKNQIDYINLHATSTPVGDLIELDSILNFFGEEVAKNITISATKSVTGHCLGAVGAMEAIFSILTLKNGVTPPTFNLKNPEEITTKFQTITKQTQNNFEYAISNSFGFGGSNAVLLFKKYNS